MGKIAELLVGRIKRQVAERGIVVWYDPAKAYSRLVERAQIPGATVLRLEDGFFRLREQMEQWLECVSEGGKLEPGADQPPWLVIYVPRSQKDCGYALIEAETAGVVMEPDAARPELSTRLGGLAEQVFAGVAPAKAPLLARQADEGLLSLEELDRMADEAASGAVGALQVIFGQASLDEIILRFAATGDHDAAIVSKNALAELAEAIGEALGLAVGAPDGPPQLREELRRFLLLGDLLAAIPAEELPDALRRLPLPEQEAKRDLVRHVCGLWRNRRDLTEAYAEASDAVERGSGIGAVALPWQRLREADTFPFVERHWLNEAAALAAAGKGGEAGEIARTRLECYWPAQRPELQLEWRVIEAAAAVCAEAALLRESLRARKWALDEMVSAYASHAAPWMRLDRWARQLETRYARLDTLEHEGEALSKALALARHQYGDTLHALALAYSRAATEANVTSSRFRRQSGVFAASVRPALNRAEKTAYFLVDALRYEMGAELVEGLGGDFEGEIEPVLGQLPGITLVGMAALLPEAERGLSLENAGGLSVSIGDRALKTRQTRLAWLTEKAGVATAVFKLGEAIRLTPKRRREIDAAQLVLVTAQEIDRLGEEAGDEEERRLFIDEILEKLRRAIRSLARAGIERFVIAADHGFHMIEAIDPGLSINAPGGETVELHPRVWIGRGGVAAEGYVRVRACDLELGGDLELAFPQGLGTFKVRGGAGTYFHGGLSPQEHVLPLITIRARKPTAPMSLSSMRVTIALSKAKITNRLFTVTLDGEAQGLLSEVEKRVRLEVLSGKTEVGEAVAAGYGFEEGTREVVITLGKPNVVTLMISTGEAPKALNIVVMDCDSQLVLAEAKDIPVELGI